MRVRAGPAMVRRAHMRAAFSEGVASGRRVVMSDIVFESYPR